MKKLFSILLVLALVLSVSATIAIAASAPHSVNSMKTGNDGVCDICNGRDSDGDGVCDNCSGSICPPDGTDSHGKHKSVNSTGFVDANNDGVCDNNTNSENCPQNGIGAHCRKNK